MKTEPKIYLVEKSFKSELHMAMAIAFPTFEKIQEFIKEEYDYVAYHGKLYTYHIGDEFVFMSPNPVVLESKADIIIADDLEPEALGSDSSDLNGSVVKEHSFTAMDVIEQLREGLIALPEVANNIAFTRLFLHLEDVLNKYDEAAKQERINLANLTKEKASDQDLQRIGNRYDMSMNQTVGYMDMCEQVNANMQGTGIVAVPFWFAEQYKELQAKNMALIEQTDNLMATLSIIQKKIESGKADVADMGLEMPTRTNIITQTTTPYIAGQTGPRMGDEHLDNDNIYIPPLRKS